MPWQMLVKVFTVHFERDRRANIPTTRQSARPSLRAVAQHVQNIELVL